MDQYLPIGSFDEGEDPAKELIKVSPYIGDILVSFSSLEHSLELAIAGLQSDRSDEPGMLIIKFLEDNQLKIDYFSETARQYILYSKHVKDSHREGFISQLKEIVKRLGYAAGIRNIIAHSKWSTITKDFMVVNSTKLNKTTGRVEVKLYKLNPGTLRQIITGINTTNDDLWKLIEKINIR